MTNFPAIVPSASGNLRQKCHWPCPATAPQDSHGRRARTSKVDGSFNGGGSSGFTWLHGQWPIQFDDLGMGQNLVPLVNIKIAGKWMFIPLKMVLIGIDP